MFNYQNNLYERVKDTLMSSNVSLGTVHRKIGEYSAQTQKFINSTSQNIQAGVHGYVKQSPFLQDVYRDWQQFYSEAYDWIHPKLSELSNTTLHYGSGVSIGILASVIILMIILSRFLPARLKNFMYLLFVLGSSTTLYMFTSISKLLSDPVTEAFIEYWQYFVAYVVIMGFISFAVVYRYGPIEDERTLSLIQWFLQLVGLVLVYNSTQLREVSFTLVVLLLTLYNFPKVAIKNQAFKNFWYRFFPPKVKLLTEDEYLRQADVETRKELEKLREYCRSPECHSWKIISKLKDPHRFAEFINLGSWHISTLEAVAHENTYNPPVSSYDTASEAGSETESELVFVLGSPRMTVRC